MTNATDLNSAALVAPRLITRREAASACVLAFACAMGSAALCVAAVIAHPPVAVVPLLVIVCVGAPVFGTWQLPHAIVALRARRENHRREIALLRRGLDQIPEVEHPLGQ